MTFSSMLCIRYFCAMRMAMKVNVAYRFFKGKKIFQRAPTAHFANTLALGHPAKAFCPLRKLIAHHYSVQLPNQDYFHYII